MKFKLFALMFVIVLLMGTVSSFEFDNWKKDISFEKGSQITIGDKEIQYNELWEKYSPIEIKNAFGFGETLWSGAIDTHTESCGSDCSSTMDINLANDGALVDDIEFYTIKKDGSRVLQDIRSYQFYIKIGEIDKIVQDYERQCVGIGEVSKNGSQKQSCSNVNIGSHMETEYIWEEYTEGKNVLAGDYKLKIDGEKKPSRTVDWVIKTNGEWINEWAEWGGGDLTEDLVSYYKLDENATNTVVVDSNGPNTGIASANTDTWSVSGLLNNAFDLEADNSDFINLGDFDILNEISISAWVTFESFDFENWIVAKDDGGSDRAYAFGVKSPNKITLQIDGNNAVADGDTTLSTGVRYHIVVTYNDSSKVIEYYLNGSSDGSTSNIGTISTNNANVNIGRRSLSPSDTHVDGIIENVGIWNKILTPTEVDDLYNSGIGFAYPFGNDVILNSPDDSSVFLNPVVEFNCSATHSIDIVNISLLTNQSGTFEIVNTTDVSGLTNETVWNHDLENDGQYLWSCQACDTDGDCGVAGLNRTVIIDTTNPIINLISPSGIISSIVIGENLSLNWSITELNIDTCWFDYNDINTTVTCGDNNYSFITVDGQQSLIFYANDTVDNLGSNTTNWSYTFIENEVTFNENATETSIQTFELNMTTDVTVLSISSILNYKGTEHISTATCDNGNCILANTIDISIVNTGESELHNFFWNFTIFDGDTSTTTTTSTREQNVSRIHLEQCNATFTIEALNFTAFDEQNITRISPYQFDGTFLFWTGSGTVKRNNSFSNNDDETVLCLSPNEEMKIDAQIDYGFSDDNTTYITRNYFFDNATISNETQHVPLFLLKNTESTTFILEVEALNLRGIPDAFIHTQRFYPGEGLFRTVQIGRTNEEGKTTGFFETETVDYKFLIVKNGEIIISTEQQKVVGESIPFTLVFRIGQTIDTPWSFYEGLDNLQKNLSFNRDTNIISFTYIDTSGSLSSARLFVTNQKYVEAPTTICDVSTILSSATLVCNVTGFNGTINAEAFIGRSPEVLVDLITIAIDNARAVFGKLGLLLGMFIILVGYSVTVFSITAGLIIGFIILVFVSMTPLVSIPPLFVWGLAALTLFVIVAVNKR